MTDQAPPLGLSPTCARDGCHDPYYHHFEYTGHCLAPGCECRFFQSEDRK